MRKKKDSKLDKLCILLAVFVISGIIGFIYETIFYRIDLGFFVKRGTSFGPWVPIYGFGGVFITLLCQKYKDKPLMIFLISLFVSTMLEFGTGYILYHVFNLRLWDYSVEILNFGNIGGYICLRSVLLFAFAGVFLVKFLIPMLYSLRKKVGKPVFNNFNIILGSLFIIDITVNAIIKFL